jgi:hypothetical protein
VVKTPEDALTQIQAAAQSGDLVMAGDQIASQYDDEIQRIYATLRAVEGKPPPKRPIWVSGDADVGLVLPRTEEGKLGDEDRRIVAEAGRRLGIALNAADLWIDAAARLRSHETSTRS